MGYVGRMRWFKIGLALLTVVLLAAFFVQNSSRTTGLSFDLGFAAWALASPISVPALMAACFFGGALVAFGLGYLGRLALSRRVRQLEQELALRGRGGAAESGGGGWAG